MSRDVKRWKKAVTLWAAHPKHAVPWQPEHAAPRRRGRERKQGIDQSYQHQPAKIQKMSQAFCSQNDTKFARLFDLQMFALFCMDVSHAFRLVCHPVRIDNTSDPTAHFLQLNWSLPCHRHRESRRTVGAKTGWLLPSGKFDQPQGSNAEIRGIKVADPCCQRTFQEPKLEVPTIYKAYIRPM